VSSQVGEVLKELLFRNRDRHAIPVMDGPMRPNSALDHCPALSEDIPLPHDIVVAENGDGYVTSGRKLLRLPQLDFAHPETVAEFDGHVTGLAAKPGGGIAVCVGELGIVLFAADHSRRVLAPEGSPPLRCPTAAVFGPNGELFVCDGSTYNSPERWVFDLMEKRRSGRVLKIDTSSGDAEMLAEGLGYPSGVCFSADGRDLIVTEAWAHSALRLPLGRKIADPAKAERPICNMCGYPGKIIRRADGYCLTVFALRTQLVDFVLEEDGYRTNMIERIDPAFWWRRRCGRRATISSLCRAGGSGNMAASRPGRRRVRTASS